MLIYFNFEQLSSFSGELDLSWVFTIPFPLLTLVGLEDEGSLKKEIDQSLSIFKVFLYSDSANVSQTLSDVFKMTYSLFLFNL